MVLVADESFETLSHLRNKAIYRGGNGSAGQGRRKSGRAGRDREIPVPLGIEVWVGDEGAEPRPVGEMEAGVRLVVARGGGGGAGNARYVTAVNQEPLLAERGEEGSRAEVILKLSLAADVGILGKPNSGKSALLSACSRARPKVAEYLFTTTRPVLGVAEVRGRQITLMEIPGLVKGAHEGAGLGARFLSYADRVRLFIHLLDGLSEDPLADFDETVAEVRHYSREMAERPQLVAVNKVDMPEVEARVAWLREQLKGVGHPVFFVSAATRQGVPELVGKADEVLKEMPQAEVRKEGGEPSVLRPRKIRERPEVESREGGFVVHFPPAERLVARVDLADYRVRVQLMGELRRLGVTRALKAAGVRRGDTVRFGDVKLEW